jgi:hypothetical protein
MQNSLYATIMIILLGNISGCSTAENGTKTAEVKTDSTLQKEAKATANSTSSQNTSAIKYEIKEGENHTFGYEISVDGTVMVKQPFIPAVSGKQGFVSKEEAEKVAQLIVKKVEKNIIPPAISIKELDSLHIHYNK